MVEDDQGQPLTDSTAAEIGLLGDEEGVTTQGQSTAEDDDESDDEEDERGLVGLRRKPKLPPSKTEREKRAARRAAEETASNSEYSGLESGSATDEDVVVE